MLLTVLLVAHIAVLGYWLGSELMLNALYRFIAHAKHMPFSERDALMEQNMTMDQSVRYALILQAGLGFALSALYGYVPGGEGTAIGAGVATVLWLAFVEYVHHVRHGPFGKRLMAIDRGSRWVILAALVAIAVGLIGGDWDMPLWMRWKLALFAGVIACGVGLRLGLVSHFRTWQIMARDGPTDETNEIVRVTYWRITSILFLLWTFIAGITALSVLKPL